MGDKNRWEDCHTAVLDLKREVLIAVKTKALACEVITLIEKEIIPE